MTEANEVYVHWLGTDNTGEDVLTLIFTARESA